MVCMYAYIIYIYIYSFIHWLELNVGKCFPTTPRSKDSITRRFVCCYCWLALVTTPSTALMCAKSFVFPTSALRVV